MKIFQLLLSIVILMIGVFLVLLKKNNKNRKIIIILTIVSILFIHIDNIIDIFKKNENQHEILIELKQIRKKLNIEDIPSIDEKQNKYPEEIKSKLALLDKINKLDPDAYFELALYAFEEKKYDLVLQHATIGLSLDNKNINLLNIAGLSLAEKGDYRNAIEYITKAIKLDPINHVLHYNLGRLYKHINMLDKAIGEYKEAIKNDYYYKEAHNNLGLIYELQGKTKDAICEYLIALRIDPNFIDALNNLGVIYIEQGLYDKAEAVFKKIKQIDKTIASVYVNLGTIYLNKAISIKKVDLLINYENKTYIAINKQSEEAKPIPKYIDLAEKELKEAIKLEPTLDDGFYNLGIIYYCRGNFDEAIIMFKKAIENNRNIPFYYYYLGQVYHNKTDYDSAIKEYEKALAIDKTYFNAYFSMGHAYLYNFLKNYKIEFIDKSISSLNEALKLKPESWEAHSLLFLTYFIKLELDLALKEAKKCDELGHPIDAYTISIIKNLKIKLAPK